VVDILMSSTPAAGLAWFVAAEHTAHTAPNPLMQGTGLPCAGTSVVVPAPAPAQVALRARVTDLPGLPPRGAPV